MRIKHLVATACLLSLSGCFDAAPAYAGLGCRMYPDGGVALLDWGAAERFDGLEATSLMAAMLADNDQAGPLADLRTFDVPKADTLYAVTAGDVVLLVRVTGNMVCPDDPVGIRTFDAAKYRVLPAHG